MRVPSSTISDTVAMQLQKLFARQTQLQTEIATGQRLTDPSDDPAAISRLLKLGAQKQDLQQFMRNEGRAMQISQSVFGGLSGLKTISDRAGELGVLGGGAIGSDSYKAYAAELNLLIEEAVQGGNTRLGTEYLFGGTKTDAPPFEATRDASGNVTSVNYVGAANGAAMQTSEGTVISPFTNGTVNSQLGDFINHLVALRDALTNEDPAAVQAASGTLHGSEDDLLVAISGVGAVQTRLEADSAQNSARFTGLEKLISQDADADLAQTVVKFQQAQNAYQAALQSGAQVVHLSLLDYLQF
jgi:flagellar hook-associated protein 3 FlgL